MAGPAFIQVASAVGNTSASGNTTLNVPYPATVTAGNSALMFVAYQNVGGTSPSPTISAPTGWSTLGSPHFSNFTFEVIFYKSTVLSGAEGGTTVAVGPFQSVGAGGVSMVIAEFSGIDPTTTFWEGLTTVGGQAGAGTITGSAITTTGPNRLGIHAVLGNTTAANTLSTPSGWTSAFSINGNNSLLQVNDISVPTATTVSAPSGTNAGATLFYGIYDFAMIPGGGADNLLGAQWL